MSDLFQPLHPGIIKLRKRVIDAGNRHGMFTGMCGGMAGSGEAAIMLLGLGLDEYGMSAASIPVIKSIIRNVSYEKAKEIACHALELETPEEVLEYSRSIMKQLKIEYI